MKKKWKITGLCTGTIALLGLLWGLLVLPCWPFRPCSLTIHSTIVELPELSDLTFANALEAVLDHNNESHIRIGDQVFVCRELAADAEIRSKYTIESVY